MESSSVCVCVCVSHFAPFWPFPVARLSALSASPSINVFLRLNLRPSLLIDMANLKRPLNPSLIRSCRLDPMAVFALRKCALFAVTMMMDVFSLVCVRQPHPSPYPTTRCLANHRRRTVPSTVVTWPKAPPKRPSRKPLHLTDKYKKFASSKTRDTLLSGKQMTIFARGSGRRC